MPPHDPVTHAPAEAAFAHLLRVVEAFAVGDARTRRNEDLARALSTKGGCRCLPARRQGRGARLVFPVARSRGSGHSGAPRFVPSPNAYAAFVFESGYTPMLEVIEAPGPLSPHKGASAEGLDVLERTLAPLGEVVVVSQEGADAARAGVLRFLWDRLGGGYDVRLSVLSECERDPPGARAPDPGEGPRVPGAFLRERLVPFFPPDGSVSWRRWRVTELCASDMARLQI